MVQLTELPLDIISMIIIMLATSTDGAGHLARFVAVCKQFRQLANQYHVLRVVRFSYLTATDDYILYDYTRHHHPRDLIWVCTHNGNRAAKIMLAKALICNDPFFWNMILEHDEGIIVRNPSAIGVLCHFELVRNFIRYGSDFDIAISRIPLFRYGILFLGYDVARGSGYLLAVYRMCIFYLTKHEILLTNVQQDLGDDATINEVASRRARLSPPTSGESLREEVLKIYNEVFPLISHE